MAIVRTKAVSKPAAISLTAILEERGSNYGKFVDHAALTQKLKKVLRKHVKQQGIELTPSQAESLEMIMHKIGRIGNGNPNYADSWRDIAGYATLVADELDGTER